MLALIDALLSDFPESESVSSYFAQRAQHELAIKQDLLPLLVFEAVGGHPTAFAMPLAAAWALQLAAAHWVDDAQDNGNMQQMHHSVLAMGTANVALAQLDTDADTLRDLMDAIGRVTALGASAQRDEWKNGRFWSKPDYFRSIAGKAAAIIATGIWLGGRLTTDDAQTLAVLKEFGLALGMSIQIADDCLDLAEDLMNGTFTLPVIEGLVLVDHPDYPVLQRLLTYQPITDATAQEIIRILEGMGALTRCNRIIRAYQTQAAAAFTLFPGLEPHFANYVAAETKP